MCCMHWLGQRSASRTMLCLLWGIGLLIGLYKVTAYSNTPGHVLPQPRQWSRDTKVLLASDRPTMLVTLHPRCVCSRATLEELARLLAQITAPIQIEILLYQPDAASNSWAESDLTIQARSIPGVAVQADPNGLKAASFGMSVSGHTAVYAPNGDLLFSGGITRSRGHAGDNAGRAAIVSILSNRQAAISRTPVFGCSIRDER
jgi:hypothetical protein